MAHIARVEVPAAIWGKVRAGTVSVSEAQVLVTGFEADWFGSEQDPPRFAFVTLPAALLDDAAHLGAIHRLRANDAVQLACALAARRADPECREMAVFDAALTDAAAIEGFFVVPSLDD